jgi:hypothetical protein
MQAYASQQKQTARVKLPDPKMSDMILSGFSNGLLHGAHQLGIG